MKKRGLFAFFVLMIGVGSLRAEMIVDVSVGTSVENRSPQGVAAEFPSSTQQLVGWCRVKGATEPIEVYHRWRRNGKDEKTVKLAIRSSNYRAWSFFTPNGQVGTYTLDVLDWDKNVLASTSFQIK
jgi:hypothetical protein